jgi:2-polyprenyl-3-methyl-5-hydroxy-6-metoxy-1,4-benzoquinol methylase
MKCGICASEKIYIEYKDVKDFIFEIPGLYDYYRCKNCEMIRKIDNKCNTTSSCYNFNYSKRKKESENKILKKIYRKLLIIFGNDFHETALKKLLLEIFFLFPLIKKIVNEEKLWVILKDKNNNKLLDVGCGNGEYIEHMSKLSWDAEGIEISKDSVEVCRNKNIKVYLGTIEEFSTNYKFDAITIRHVLEHIENPESFMYSIKKHLAENGKIYLTTPNANSFNSLKYGNDWLGLDVSRHEIIYTKRSIEHLFAKVGIKIESIKITKRIDRFVGYASLMRKNNLNPYKDKNLKIKLISYINYIINIILSKEGDEIYVVAVL